VQRVFRHLRILWRVESTIAEARLRVTMRRSVLYALAGLIAVFGLGMLNVAAFFALAPYWGPTWAAFAAALGDFLLAVVMVAIALAARPASDLNTAVDLRQAAIDGLEAEFSALQEPLAWLTRAARNPIDTALPAIIVPLVTAIIRGLRKNKGEPQ
jgi:hypothetical protein